LWRQRNVRSFACFVRERRRFVCSDVAETVMIALVRNALVVIGTALSIIGIVDLSARALITGVTLMAAAWAVHRRGQGSVVDHFRGARRGVRCFATAVLSRAAVSFRVHVFVARHVDRPVDLLLVVETERALPSSSPNEQMTAVDSPDRSLTKERSSVAPVL
jgi:hypothetical protein